MVKKAVLGILISLIIVITVISAGCTNQADYVVGVDADYPPYSSVDENGNYVGFDIESIKWIAEQQGFTVEIKGIAWDGIIPALLTKKIDMVYSGMSITPDREKQVNFSIPYWSINQSVAVKADDTTSTIEDFKAGKLIIGVQRSCSADQWMQDFFGEETYNKMVKDGKIKLYNDFPSSMMALKNSLVQAVIFDDVNINYYISVDKTNSYKVLGTIDDTEEQYAVAMRKDDTELHALINEGLEKLMASDKWDELLQKYMV